MPSPEVIAAVYARDYFSGPGAGYDDYFGAERAVTLAKARTRIARLKELGATPGGTWLDVGCADGGFVAEARAQGFRAHGVEVSPEARSAMAPEIAAVVHESIASASVHGPFDVITMWDVLEHLPEPIAALRALRHTLAPRGLVGIVLPVIDNANARWWPASWDQYKPPEHLWFFSRAALRTVIERELAANVVHEESAWRREARWLDVARPASGPLSRGLRAIERAAWRSAAAIGALDPSRLDDSVAMYARKS
jgi:cyclopropane fatty-acyl-phospholipid synthase-like methyltransferase